MNFSHVDEEGKARMVDVSEKEITKRVAVASGYVYIKPEVIRKIKSQDIPKGDVLAVARIAGIQAAKKTGELIPMCHPLGLDHVDISFDVLDDCIKIRASATVTAKTGIEMEALTAVSVAALTVYDMCKSADKTMVIGEICLQEKSGGRSGHYVRGKTSVSAKILGVSIGDKRGISKSNIGKARLIEDYGVEGDAHAGTPNQQVSFIGIETYRRINEIKNLDCKPGDFAENITTEGVSLTSLPVGTKMLIGEAELQITKIGKKYSTGFKIEGIGEPPLMREGIFARVLKGGEVSIGDTIEIIEPDRESVHLL